MNLILIISAGAVALLFIGYLVYRNILDEKAFEHDADDTHAQPHHPGKENLEERQ